MIEATLGVWDTNLLSHAIPGRSRHALYQSVTDLGQVTTAAPVVEEWLWGVERKAKEGPAGDPWRAILRWYADEVSERRLAVIAYDRDAAALAAAMRARLPARRLRADIRIAACAWINATPVLTADQVDFQEIKRHLSALFPRHPPLEIVTP